MAEPDAGWLNRSLRDAEETTRRYELYRRQLMRDGLFPNVEGVELSEEWLKRWSENTLPVKRFDGKAR